MCSALRISVWGREFGIYILLGGQTQAEAETATFPAGPANRCSANFSVDPLSVTGRYLFPSWTLSFLCDFADKISEIEVWLMWEYVNSVWLVQEVEYMGFQRRGSSLILRPSVSSFPTFSRAGPGVGPAA